MPDDARVEAAPASDVFLCHAGEDKAEVVDALVAALQERGVRVWYDAFEVRLGDDFRRKMERSAPT